LGSPVFSPDGRTIAYWTSAAQTDQGTLKKIGTSGGAAVALATIGLPFGLSWDDTGILAGQRKGVVRLPANGGTPDVLVSLKDTEAALHPQILAGGRVVLFTLANVSGVNATANWDAAQIVTQSLTSGERRQIVQGSDGRYLPTGHLLYALGGVLFAVPFDVG